MLRAAGWAACAARPLCIELPSRCTAAALPHCLRFDVSTRHACLALQETCDVLPLQSGQDYRRLLAAQAPPLRPLPVQQPGAAPAVHPASSYFFPLGPAAAAALEQQWRNVTGQAAGGGGHERQELPVMFGRNLHVVSAPLGACGLGRGWQAGRRKGGGRYHCLLHACLQPL